MPLFQKHLYELDTYKPPLEGRSTSEQLLLDFNERTLPVSDHIKAALCEFVNSGPIQKYPEYAEIEAKIADYVGVETRQVMITNGSDQGIDVVARAALNSGDAAIIPAPSFAIYAQTAAVQNARIISPRYTLEQGFPTESVIDSITEATRLIVIPQPNNPCGTTVPIDDIRRISEAAPNAVILVDECYYEYSGLTVVDLVAEYSNLVVARTFSKTWGLPSLRFGFLVSSEDNICQLLKVRGPYDINQLAVVAVDAALAKPEYTKDYVEEVMHQSKPRLEAWLREKSIVFWPSGGNYLWAFPDQPEALASFLREKHIRVRPKKNAEGALGLRITLGTLSQTEQLISQISSFYGNR